MYDIPNSWERGGLVLARGAKEKTAHGWSVVGDPCIVRDESVGGWRMFLFYDPPGHGQAICRSETNVGAGQWTYEGPLPFTNPEVAGHTHKPYVVTEAYRPNHAALVDGKYWLLSVGIAGRKFVHRAWSTSLAGPWTWEKGALIDVGAEGDWDAKHIDAISGLYFPDRKEFVYFYMGYPKLAQPRLISPFGSAQGVAVQKAGETSARELGIILPPEQRKGHWASGYVGGIQPVPGKKHRWVAMANASPTAPNPNDGAKSREEPPPSLGGFAVCEEEYPIHGWRWLDDPIEHIQDIPADAAANGEGVNLWRHHLLQLPDQRSAVFYNSGSYGTEQLYLKWARQSNLGV